MMKLKTLIVLHENNWDSCRVGSKYFSFEWHSINLFLSCNKKLRTFALLFNYENNDKYQYQ